jgi:TetR/AcrR family transcriptional repressor of nem operon
MTGAKLAMASRQCSRLGHRRRPDALAIPLVGEAIDAASIETVAAMKEASKPAQGPARLGIILDRYLSREHLAHPGYGCPVAALAGGAAHEMKAAREALQRAVGRMLAMLEADGPGAKRERRRRLAALSSAVGALVLGRVLEGTPAGEEVIDSVRAELLAAGDRRMNSTRGAAHPRFS